MINRTVKTLETVSIIIGCSSTMMEILNLLSHVSKYPVICIIFYTDMYAHVCGPIAYRVMAFGYQTVDILHNCVNTRISYCYISWNSV